MLELTSELGWALSSVRARVETDTPIRVGPLWWGGTFGVGLLL